LPPYVEARLGNKVSNQVRVYVNACPKMLESNQRSNDSIDSSSPVINLDMKGLFNFNFKARAQEVAHQACSNDCPENVRRTCHLIYGSRDARFVFVLMRANVENLGQHTNPCAKSEDWDEKSLSELNYFRDMARNFAKGLDLSKLHERFGVWVSDKVGVDDADCPVGDFTSYGYVIKGAKDSNNKAYAIVSSKKAVYCSGEGELEEAPQIFAHEQIGHIFAKLDDEYETCNGSPQGFESMPHYNCTDPKNVVNEGIFKYKTKWGELGTVPHQGCGYSNTLVRATLNSVMRNHRMRAFLLFGSLSDFGPINEKVIKETIENYPNGYDQWAEKIIYRCENNE